MPVSKVEHKPGAFNYAGMSCLAGSLEWTKNTIKYGKFVVIMKESSANVLQNDNTHFSLHCKTCHKAGSIFFHGNTVTGSYITDQGFSTR